MSRSNKVNPDHYKTAGRLTADDLARERRKQSEPLWGATRRRKRVTPTPPWMTDNAATGERSESAAVDERETEGSETMAVDAEDAAVSMNEDESGDAAQQPQAKPRARSQNKQRTGNQKKTARRTSEKRKQETRTGATRGARSANAKTRTTPKASGARGTPRGGGKSRATGAATRTVGKAKKAAGARKSVKAAKTKKAKRR